MEFKYTSINRLGTKHRSHQMLWVGYAEVSGNWSNAINKYVADEEESESHPPPKDFHHFIVTGDSCIYVADIVMQCILGMIGNRRFDLERFESKLLKIGGFEENKTTLDVKQILRISGVALDYYNDIVLKSRRMVTATSRGQKYIVGI